MRKVCGLGGKLGKDVVDLYYKLKAEDKVLRDVHAPTPNVPLDAEAALAERRNVTMSAFLETCRLDLLIKHLGRETGVHVHAICTGDDGDAPVNAKKTSIQSFTSAKQFDERSQLQDSSQLDYWLPILAGEVIERCDEERIENKRYPLHVSVHYTRVGAKSKGRAFALGLDTSVESVVKAAKSALMNDLDSICPCAHLSIHVKDFMSIGSRNPSISSFFGKSNALPREIEASEAIQSDSSRVEEVSMRSDPTKSKRKANFFAPAIETAESALPTSSMESPFFCDSCDQFVYEPRGEHKDFHYALALSQGTTSTMMKWSSSAQPGVPNKRPKGQGPMDMFLKK
jgi:hypothetical protein